MPPPLILPDMPFPMIKKLQRQATAAAAAAGAAAGGGTAAEGQKDEQR